MASVSSEERKDVHNSDTPMVCRSCEARHRGICGALSPEQLLQLSQHTSRKVVDDSTELHGADESVEYYANIMSGVVKLSKMMPDGRQQIVGLQFAPDFVGRPFSSQTSVAAEAATMVRVCSFPRAALEKIVSETPKLEHRLHEQALKELDEARDWMLTLGRKSAVEKVASFLLLIVTHIDPEHEDDSKPFEIELPMKRADIADFLGLTIETVSRQLTNLRKRGVIDIRDRRTVIVPSVKRLLAATQQDLSK